MPRGENRERVRPRSAGETVAVGAGQGRTPGVKARRGPLRHAHRNVGRQHLVDGPLGPVEVGTGVNVGGHHLSPGMHPGVGTSGAGQHYGVPQGPLQGTAEGTGDRVHTALGGEAMKRGPQVGDEQTHPTRRRGPVTAPVATTAGTEVPPAGMSTGNSVPATVPPDGEGLRPVVGVADPGGSDELDAGHGGVVTVPRPEFSGSGYSPRAARRNGALSRRRACGPCLCHG